MLRWQFWGSTMSERTESIFGAVAQHYYDRGLPVIPLHFHDKRPLLNDWARYHNLLPDADLQKYWISQYPANNIGIVLGEQSGICMLDIDTTNEALIKIIQSLIPPSPWYKIGAKGLTLAFKFNGLSTFRIRTEAGETVVELLSTRTQTVLPPSIHPTTKQPYRDNGKHLWDVLDQLPELDLQIETILRGALTQAGVNLSHSGWTRVTDFVASGSRDVTITSVAGLYAHGVIRGERSLREAIGIFRAYMRERIENVVGDEIDEEKHIRNLITFLKRDVLEKDKQLPTGWDEGLSADDKKNLGLDFTADNIEWNFDHMVEYLQSQFGIHPAETGSTGRARAVELVLGKIGKAQNLSTLDEERILTWIAETSGLRVKASSLRKRIREVRSGDLKGENHTEIAVAVIGDFEKVSPFRFYAGQFWYWAGSHWMRRDTADIMGRIASEYGNLSAARKQGDHSGIMKVMQNLTPRGLQTVDIKGINFVNGFLNAALQLLPHSPDYGMTYTLPYRYVPEVANKARHFMDFLHRVWGQDADYLQKVDALQDAICVTMFGLGPKFQRAILLHGAAKTGKSTMIQIVESLIADGAKSRVAPHDWADKFIPTGLANKLINMCGELSEDKLIDGARFKGIVDGDVIQGQFKGQQVFEFQPIATHWFASNHMPKTRDTSNGFNRRWVVLDFNHPIKDNERKLDYASTIIAEEREAICAWAVQAMPRLLQRNDITLPPSHEQFMREVANMNNSVRFFIVDSGQAQVVTPTGEKTSARTSELILWNKYYSFCIQEGGARAVSQKTFRARMRELSSELNFKVSVVPTPHGGQECFYENVILASAVRDK
jgi:putative DNA primase/helicase